MNTPEIEPANLTNEMVYRAIQNTLLARGLDEKYPLGPETFHRPHGSFVKGIPGGDSLLPEDASEEDKMAVANFLLSLDWDEITASLSDEQRMGKNRYVKALVPEGVEAFEAAVHFTDYLDLIGASKEVREGKEPVPGLNVRVAFHKGPDLSSTILPPQRTNVIVMAIGATEWKNELYYGSHWHYIDEDPMAVPNNMKCFFWAPGGVYPAGQTVKLYRV